MNADGSDPHEIVFNERTAAADHVRGIAWSPAGDRIALGFDVGIYTFAPDGSAFHRGDQRWNVPYWSPAVTIAYTIAGDPDGCGLAIADADGSNVRGVRLRDLWSVASRKEHRHGAAPPPTDDVSPTPGPSALAYGVDGDVFLADCGWLEPGPDRARRPRRRRRRVRPG